MTDSKKEIQSESPYKGEPRVLEIRLTGPGFKGKREGKVALEDLAIVSNALFTTLERFILRKVKGLYSLRRGVRAKPVKERLQLYLFDVKPGSVILEFSPIEEQSDLEAEKPGSDDLSEFVSGIVKLQDPNGIPPGSFDRGVLQGINMLKPLFNRGVDEVRFGLKGYAEPVKAIFDSPTSKRVDTLLLRPAKNQRSVSGVIMEADFHAPEVRFEVFTQDGKSIPGIASEEDFGNVLSCVMQHVRITGEAEEDEFGNVKRIRADNIELTGGGGELELPYGSIKEFWSGVNLEDLIDRQGVTPFDPKLEPEWVTPSEEEIERYLSAIRKHEHR